jgi:hypothetical protein
MMTGARVACYHYPRSDQERCDLERLLIDRIKPPLNDAPLSEEHRDLRNQKDRDRRRKRGLKPRGDGGGSGKGQGLKPSNAPSCPKCKAGDTNWFGKGSRVGSRRIICRSCGKTSTI